MVRGLLVGALLVLLGGCAAAPEVRDPHDPFERFNRSVYAFNDALDRSIVRPVAETYDAVLPGPVNRGISNFFSNLDDVLVTLNGLLQGKFAQAGSDFSRVVWNTTIGLGGLFDVATHLGLPKHNADLGQTFGHWGAGPGPYLVLPVLGPSTVRDSVGRLGDGFVDPVYQVRPPQDMWGTVLVRGVDDRAALLGASRLVEQAALDPYIFIREAYLQHRRNLIRGDALDADEFDPFAADDFDPFADEFLPEQ